jgi:hypothetical protein
MEPIEGTNANAPDKDPSASTVRRALGPRQASRLLVVAMVWGGLLTALAYTFHGH